MYQSKSILLFTFLFVFVTVDTQLKFKRFLCDSAEKANKLESLEFERALVKNHTVYLVAKSGEVFKFKFPILFDHDHQILHLYGPFYEAKLEKPLPERQFIGYYVNGLTTSEMKGIERYREKTDRNRKNHNVVSQNQTSHNETNENDEQFFVFLKLNDLKAGDSFELAPARRVEISAPLADLLEDSKLSLFFVSKKSNSLVIILEGDGKGSLYLTRSHNSTGLKTVDLLTPTFVGLSRNVTFWLYDELEETNRTLFWLDLSNDFHVYTLASGPKETVRISIVEKFSAAEWFGCPVAELAKLEPALKGIFYSDQMFFLFINHNYLKIGEDLVKSMFELRKEHLRDFVGLQTRDVDYGFENKVSKFVKTIRGSALLVLPAGQIYELSVKQNQLAFQPVNEKGLSSFVYPNCLGQTLSITNIFFCFNETHYHALHDPEEDKRKVIHEIAGLFANMGVYTKGEKLQYTFDYQQDEFVLMTRTALYLIKYRAVRVELTSYKMFIENRESVRKTENRLFELAKDVSVTTMTTDKITSSDVETSSQKTSSSQKASTPHKTKAPYVTDSSQQTSSPQKISSTTGTSVIYLPKDSYNLISMTLFGLFAAVILLTLLFYVINFARKQKKRKRDPDLLKAFMMTEGSALRDRASKSRASSHGSRGSSQFVRSLSSSMRKSKNTSKKKTGFLKSANRH